MSFSNIGLAFLLLAIPGIIILYMLKQKGEDIKFSSVFLWEEFYKNFQAKSPWDKLKKYLQMYLQIAIVILLTLALMAPFIHSKKIKEENVILVLDSSASMLISSDGENTRFDEQKDKAIEYINDLENPNITIIEANDNATVLISNSKDKSKAKNIIRDLECTNKAGNVNCAKDIISTYSSENDSNIVVITDEPFDSGNLNATVINVYKEADNISVDYVGAILKDGKYTVMVKATNYGNSAVRTEINLYGDSSIIGIKELSIEPGSSGVCYFEEIEFQGQYLKANINHKDALDIDNEAYYICNSNSGGNTLLYSNGNVFIEGGVETCAQVTVEKTSDYKAVDSKYNLIIADADMSIGEPIDKLNTNLILFAPNTNKDLDITVKETKENAFIKLGNNELTQYVEGFQFGVNQIKTYEKPSWATEILSFDGQCVGYYGIYNDRKICVLGFDLRDTDFALCVEYPIFLSNILSYMLESNIVNQDYIQTGDSVNFLVDMSSENISIKGPKDSYELKATTNYIDFYNTEYAGLYSVEQIGETNKSEFFYVQFPCDIESDGITEGVVAVSGENIVTNVSGNINLKNLFYFLALIILIIETIIYNKNSKIHVWMKVAIALLIVLSLLDVSYRVKIKENTTVFVVDLSKSCTQDIADYESYIRDEIKDMPSDNKVAIVTFGGDAITEQYLTEEKIFSEFTTTPIESASDLEGAVLRALSLYPNQGGKRLIMLTDGKETNGNINKIINTLTSEEISVGTIYTNSELTNEVYITDVILPERINIGDEITIKVNINSNVETKAKVVLHSGRSLVGTQEVFLNKGVNQFIFTDIGKEDSTQSYRVVVEPVDDTISVNNEQVAYTQVESSPKLLVIEGSSGNADNFKVMLDSCNYKYDVVSAKGAPDNINELLEYKSIIAIDVYYDDFREGFINILDDYVGDYGGGFICIGGENSFALGNYRETVLEEILPVHVELQGEQKIPKTAMVMVIDHSGSMSSPATDDTSITGLDLAKKAALGAIDSLRSVDMVGVLAFDDGYTWSVPLQEVSDRESIGDGIRQIEYGGGTSIYPALEEAINEISKSDASVKHVILLTDGQDGNSDYEELINIAKENGITISTVAAGSDSDVNLLQNIAEAAEGRYYYSDINSNIPRIFAKEMYISSKAYLINEDFYPVVTSNSNIVTTVYNEGWYELHGYIATTPKQYSSVHIQSHRGDPILASWQYGLGHSIAWTSDISNGWTGNYVNDTEFVQLWRNIIDSSILSSDANGDYTYVDNSGGGSVISYFTEEYSENTKVEGVYIDQEGNSITVDFSQKAPGEFVADVDLIEQGVYSFNIRKKEGDEVVNNITSSIAVQYSKEYRGDISSQGYENFVQAVNGQYLTYEDNVWDIKVTNQGGQRKIGFILALIAFILFLIYILISRLDIKFRRVKRKSKIQNKVISTRNNNAISSDIEQDIQPDLGKNLGQDVVLNEGQSSGKNAVPNNNLNTNHTTTSKVNKSKKNKTSKESKKKENESQQQSLDTSMLLKKKNDRNIT